MRQWHSLYDILQFPIGVMYVAMFLLGLGNLLTNPFFTFINIHSQVILLLAEAMIRIGSFLIVNFPLLFLIRLVSRKAGSATSIISAISGYVGFLVMTMCFARQGLPNIAFSSILGLSSSSSNLVGVGGGVRYPLQTGVIAITIVSVITLSCFNRSRHHSEYGVFGFISKDVWCVIQTTLLCLVAGVVVAYVWPLAISIIQREVNFISQDTTNPINLTLYGILERFLSVLNINVFVRNPFWYSANGGSWANIAGGSIVGDVNIWTSQITSANITGMSGRFITPHFVMNLFAIPGLIWGIFSIRTDSMEKRRMLMFHISLTIISLLSGLTLPVELAMLFLAPLLFIMHVGFMGIAFGICQSMHVYLGYNYAGTNVISALPGTLPEFITYATNPTLRQSVISVLIIGAIYFVLYFLITRLYFRYLSLDLFHTGQKDHIIEGTIEAVGGITNIKMVHASPNRLVLGLSDPTVINVNKLRELGALRVYETKAGYAIAYGASSSVIRKGIYAAMRNSVREA